MRRRLERAAVAASVRLYAALLRLYPAEFREEYGAEMTRMFRDLCRSAHRRGGARGLTSLWGETLVDAARSAPVESMNTLLQDVRYGLRSLWSNRALTVVAVTALALGSGVNTAIFSVVDGVLLKPLPFPEPSRLVWIETNKPQIGITRGPTSMPDFRDWKAQSTAFDDMAAFDTGGSILDDGSVTERVSSGVVTETFFDILGIRPISGRTFTAEETVYGGPPAVVLGRGLWVRKFGGDPGVVGRQLTVGGTSATVVGVVPDALDSIAGSVEVWRPLAQAPRDAVRDNRGIAVVGRLAPGRTAEEAEAELRGVAARLETLYPKENAGWSVDVVSLHDALTRNARASLLVLFGAVCFVVLIACANVSNLLLARGTARQREIAVRAALGATRFRIARQLLTESVLLFLAGGAAGLALAVVTLKALVAIAPSGVPRLADATIDLRVLAFTFGLSVAAGLVFGSVPAFHASKADLNESLKEAGRGVGSSRRRNRVRAALVVSEIALAFVLVIGAGLFVESFSRLQSVDPGFDPKGVVSANVSLPRARYSSSDARARFFEDALARLAATPGIASVGLASAVPLDSDGLHLSRSVIPGGRPEVPEEEINAEYTPVSPDYFRTMRREIVRGRSIAPEDRAGSLPVVVVNETLARQIAPDGDAVGRQVHFWHDEPGPRTVVGIVADAKSDALDKPPSPGAYVPYEQDCFGTMVFVARAAGDEAPVGPAIAAELRKLDPGVAVYRVQPLGSVVAESTSNQRFRTLLLAAFAAVALLLATTGVYAVMWYAVVQRRHEIGVRIALGATPRDVVRLVLGHGAGLALAGVALGVCFALALGKLVAGLLYGTSAANPATLVAGAAVLVAVAAAASYFPARRASSTDPLVALRGD